MKPAKGPTAGRIVGILAICCALAVTGCVNVTPGGQEPSRLFTLSPKSTFSKKLPKVDWHLNVDVPVAGTALNTPKIALRRSPFALDYFARATWVDRAPAMVQALLVESFGNTQKIVSVTGQAVAPRANYSLETELREFQAEYDGKEVPAVRVRVNAKLVELPRRTVVAATTAERVERAKGTDLDSIINAFDEALGRVMRRIVEWTLTALPEPKK